MSEPGLVAISSPTKEFEIDSSVNCVQSERVTPLV